MPTAAKPIQPLPGARTRPVTVNAHTNDTESTRVRGAEPGDEHAIAALIAAWSEQGLTLPRTAQQVAECIGEFAVAELATAGGTRVLACGSLSVFAPSIAEIRSVAVHPDAKGKGLGKGVVERLVEEAQLLGVDRLVLLTRVPQFFRRCQFHDIDANELPSAFLQEAIAGRGRSIEGRAVMTRPLY